MSTISTRELQETLETGDATVVNVLPEEHYREEHIPGSINIPEDRLAEEVPDRFETDDEIVVYCLDADCEASPRSAEAIRSMGFGNVRDYEPGIAGWKDAGLETVAA